MSESQLHIVKWNVVNLHKIKWKSWKWHCFVVWDCTTLAPTFHIWCSQIQIWIQPWDKLSQKYWIKTCTHDLLNLISLWWDSKMMNYGSLDKALALSLFASTSSASLSNICPRRPVILVGQVSKNSKKDVLDKIYRKVNPSRWIKSPRRMPSGVLHSSEGRLCKLLQQVVQK